MLKHIEYNHKDVMCHVIMRKNCQWTMDGSDLNAYLCTWLLCKAFLRDTNNITLLLQWVVVRCFCVALRILIRIIEALSYYILKQTTCQRVSFTDESEKPIFNWVNLFSSTSAVVIIGIWIGTYQLRIYLFSRMPGLLCCLFFCL